MSMLVSVSIPVWIMLYSAVSVKACRSVTEWNASPLPILSSVSWCVWNLTPFSVIMILQWKRKVKVFAICYLPFLSMMELAITWRVRLSSPDWELSVGFSLTRPYSLLSSAETCSILDFYYIQCSLWVPDQISLMVPTDYFCMCISFMFFVSVFRV